MPITTTMLLKNIDQDIVDAAEQHGFHFSDYSRRATPARTLKFLLQRGLLTQRDDFIARNENTARYIAKLPDGVVDLIDSLPVCDPLTLLAGTSVTRHK
ncbi:MAG: hypothetical protein AB7L09_03180 [Nitrospira sp.]